MFRKGKKKSEIANELHIETGRNGIKLKKVMRVTSQWILIISPFIDQCFEGVGTSLTQQGLYLIKVKGSLSDQIPFRQKYLRM